MELRDLPDDILRLVFKRSLYRGPFRATALKINLALLLVCQRWRHLALPTVYSEVFIELEQQICSGDCAANDEEPGNNHPEGIEITTNLGLVVAAGCLRTAKVAEIKVLCVGDPLPSLNIAIQRMHAAGAVWSSTTVLKLSIYSGPPSAVGRGGTRVAGHEDKIKQIRSALVAMLPRVHRAHFSGLDTAVCRDLYGQLIEHYADQLCTVNAYAPTAASPDRTLSQLVHASFEYSGDCGHRLPQMNPANLRSLVLFDRSANCSWAPFSTGDGDMAIEFSNLTSFRVANYNAHAVGGAAAWHRSSFPWKLRFPKLRNINMFCTDSVLPLLECATLPSHVDSIRIYAAAPVLQCVSGLALPATRRIEIGTDGRGGNTVNGDGVAMVAAACRILEKAQGAKELALVIGDSWPRVQPEHITFTSITELRISPSANMDAMLGLLQRLPKLVNVWFDSFDAETVDVDLLLPGPDEGCAVEPLHASIKKMEVYSIDSAASRENSAAVVNYLLLKIPTLARLNAHRTLSAPVLQFVKAYSEQHPRLSRVKLRLCNEED